MVLLEGLVVPAVSGVVGEPGGPGARDRAQTCHCPQKGALPLPTWGSWEAHLWERAPVLRPESPRPWPLCLKSLGYWPRPGQEGGLSLLGSS